MKSDKMWYIIYTDIESLIKKTDECTNNPENSLTIKIGEHIPCGYSMPPIWVFDHIENKRTSYLGKDYCYQKKSHQVLQKITVIKIASSCTNMLICGKKNLKKNSLKVEIIEKLKIIVICREI